jgi:hypothetical protein
MGEADAVDVAGALALLHDDARAYRRLADAAAARAHARDLRWSAAADALLTGLHGATA